MQSNKILEEIYQQSVATNRKLDEILTRQKDLEKRVAKVENSKTALLKSSILAGGLGGGMVALSVEILRHMAMK